MFDPCCRGDLGYLLLQINIICLLLALIGTMVVVKHPTWFSGLTPPAQTVAER